MCLLHLSELSEEIPATDYLSALPDFTTVSAQDTPAYDAGHTRTLTLLAQDLWPKASYGRW